MSSNPNVKTRNDASFNAIKAVTAEITSLNSPLNETLTITGTGALGAVVLAAGRGGVTYSKGTVTQATNITTAVTLNQTAGIITTQAATTAADATSTFTVNNNRVLATSGVVAWVMDYAGTFSTNGIPVVNVDTVAAGSFTINISNAHSANALAGALRIGFLVL